MICLIDGDPLAYIAMWDVENLEEACGKIDKLIAEIPSSVFADDFRVAVKGPGNFRDEVYSEYKAQRNPDPESAKTVRDLRDYMVEAHGAIEAEGQEADDLLAQWAFELSEKEIEWAIASIDKDLLTIPGTHYNIRKGIIEHVDEDRADYLLNKQLLMGDRADNIPGLSGIGDKRAEKLLEGVPYGQRRNAVIAAYRDHYGDNWENELQLTGDLIYIRPIKDERFKI